MGDPIDYHPPVQHLFEEYLPDGHPDVDELMRRGFVLPRYHPDISLALDPRSLATSPGALLSYCIASIVLAILLVRCVGKTRRRTTKIARPSLTPVPSSDSDDAVIIREWTMGQHDSIEVECRKTAQARSYAWAFISRLGGEDDDNVEVSFNEEETVETELKYEGAPPSLDQRRHHIMGLNKNHHDDELGPQENVRRDILAYEEKKSTMLRSNWSKTFGLRFVKSDVSMGEAISCLVYVIINVIALLASPTYSYDLGFGSLAAGNTLFLVMTA